MSPSFPPPAGAPVIDGEPPRQRPRWARPLFWASIALIVVGVVGLLGDWATRTWEMSRLVTAIENSEAAMATAQDAIAAVNVPDDPTSAQKQQAASEWERASSVGRAEVAAAGDGVADLTFLPWHTEVLRAQAAYLDHNGAWVDYLDRGSRDPATLFTDDNRIEPTWIAAEQWVRAALPFPTVPPLAARVDEIFTDEEPADEPGGLPA